MANFNDLKISQLKNELEQHGLATNGVNFGNKWRNIHVEEYELEEETRKLEEVQCS